MPLKLQVKQGTTAQVAAILKKQGALELLQSLDGSEPKEAKKRR